jgi:hypothetical protein
MSYDFNGYMDIMRRLLTLPPNDTTLPSVAPRMIDYAEQRCYRELDLLSTVTADHSVKFAANSRILALPTNPHFITVQKVNVITPSSVTNPEAGTRNALTQTTEEYLDNVWSSATGATVPTHVATLSDQTFLVGPWPDATYTVEFVGTIRPAPLSPSNTTTFLTTYLPDLFIAASMIFGTGWQRDFGAQSDDPQAAMSWSTQYQALFNSAKGEELRKKWAGGAWSAMEQAPTATDNRGAPAAMG